MVGGRAHRWSTPSTMVPVVAVLALLAPAAGSTFILSWTQPPPEFADVTDGWPGDPDGTSGIYARVAKWAPAAGPASSLLDLLPPGGPALGDYNRDGFPDLFVPVPSYTDDALNALRTPRSRLYMNDGSARLIGIMERFIDVTDLSGIDVQGRAYGASWGDLDGDGFPDLLVTGYRLAQLFRNNHDGTFTDVTIAVGLPQDGIVLGGAWGDYDRDGDLDLFLPRFSTYTHPDDGLPTATFQDVPGASNALLRNNGDGTFTDVTAAAGMAGVSRRTTSATFVDVDGDLWPDVYATNLGQPAEYWRNNGDGTFTDTAAAAGIADGQDGTCQAWEDFDRDGDLDLYVGHQDGAADGLYLNDGGGTFSDGSATAGFSASVTGRAWGCGALDHDSDGDMDVVAVHGHPEDPQAQRALLLTNRMDLTGPLAFEDTTSQAGDHSTPGYEFQPTIAEPRAGGGIAIADVNLDENTPDILFSPSDGGRVRLFKNVGHEGGWTGGNGHFFRAVLRGTTSNAMGLGATVTVSAGVLTVTRQLGTSAGYGSNSLTDLWFGLHSPEGAGYVGQPLPVSVTIRWPSGIVESYPNAFPAGDEGKAVIFVEGGGTPTAPFDTNPPRPEFTPSSGTAGSNGWFTSDSITLRVKASDAVSSVGGSEFTDVQTWRHSRDGVAWTTVCSGKSACRFARADLTFAGDGTHPLWLEMEDVKGNRATYLYPIRIDTSAPALTLLTPRAGGVYAQGREVAYVPELAAANRAVVVAPVPLQPSGVVPGAEPLDPIIGALGLQLVAASASDPDSGLWTTQFILRRADGAPVDGMRSALLELPPYAWEWPAGAVPAGEYRLSVEAVNRAGLASVADVKVEVVPATPEGWMATIERGPSLPTLT